ncbi:MAG TPA: right-handed parallel beta-helix repeat-containing protein [Anaerolineales bacterium]|nr:right-handed parallel beta-helix repeat-containing protein [Anaerolineales bacterium]
MRPYLRRLFTSFLSLVLFINPVSLREFTASGPVAAQSNLTYTVDRLTDVNPGGGGVGSGLTGDLRYTVYNAKSGDTITSNLTGTIHLAGGLPSLAQSVKIEGPKQGGLTVHGNGSAIVFAISNGASVVISNLTITGGRGNGGGIFNNGLLTLNNVTISGNMAGDPTNGGGTGAGIWNYTSGMLTVNNSTVSGNNAFGNSSYNPSRGAGIANYGTLTLNNTTVSGNSVSEGSGGAISNTLATSILTLNNSTISANSATGAVGLSGGIDNHGNLTAVNSIIADNAKGDFRGALTSQGHNLIGSTSGGSGFRPDLGDLLNINPQLGPLKGNGGPTWTHALLAGSPAINAGDNGACPATDQRGVTRPQGGHCDIGVYEFGVSSLTLMGKCWDSGCHAELRGWDT